MTLQVVLGGSDGILIATDTKHTGLPHGPLLRGSVRHALQLGKTRSGQFGAVKVLFNKNRTIAIACSGWKITQDVAESIVERLDTAWGELVPPIEALCNEAWEKLPEDEREIAVASTENALLIAHSEKRDAFKFVYGKDGGKVQIHHRWKSQRFVLLGGDDTNPAGMILERYLPAKPPSINRLVFLAAHYILTGGKLNPAGIEGLAMYFSKDGSPFQEVDENVVVELIENSERLSKNTQRRLLQAAILA